jgi:hypothetical protein
VGEFTRGEAQHAALSWRVAQWAQEQLDPAARERVIAAGREAMRDLERELQSSPSSTIVEVAGAPSPSAALGMFARFERAWEAAFAA